MSGLTTLPQSIAEHLAGCADLLLNLNSSTEDDFLTVGAHLRDLSLRAGDISAAATQAAGLINGEELKEDMTAFQGLFSQMERYLKTSDMKLVGSAETLSGILREVESAYTPLAGFRKIVKHLRMLAVSTKIESARLVTGDGSFSTLADDVEKLSNLIDLKSAGILDAINSLSGAIKDTLSRVGILEKREHGQARTMADSISRGLKALSETYVLSSTTAQRIGQGSGEISANIAGIVNSLQFHDITRQQIEHVVEAITGLVRDLSSLEGSPDSTGGAADLFVDDVCALQADQLMNAKSELVTAVDRILRDLKSIARNADALSEEVTSLVSANGSRDGSFLVRVKADVSTIISSLKANGEAGMELSAAVEGVSRTIDDLSRFVGDIEDVGMEIELIALNARVRAAKTGEEGAALGVLAEEMRSLSDHSRAQTTSVSDTLTHVTDIARSLGGSRAAGTEEETADEQTLSPLSEPSADHMVGNLHGLISSFTDMDTRIAALISRMEQAGGDLTTRIGELITGITAHERTEQALGKAIAEIQGAARLAAGLGPSSKGAQEKEAYLKAFAERYTMHRERHVHNSRILPGGAFEAGRTDTAETLGENVEFF